MLTPDDLRDSTRASGYRGVSNAQSANGTQPLWCAKKGKFKKGTAADDWHGPCRKDPREAAQDYCDYINNGSAVTPATLKSAGHKAKRPRLPDDPEVQAALGVIKDARGAQAGNQGYVYLIADDEYVKIGFSTNPEARVAELQTGNARRLRLLAVKEGTLEDERATQQRHIQHNVLMEWFRPCAAIMAEFNLSVRDV